jgi:hypothetical protein
MAVQILLSATLIYTWKNCNITEQWLIATIVMLVLSAVHTWAKFTILKRSVSGK